MKALIVFYSLEGNTEKAANVIKEVTGDDTQVVQLKPVKDENKKGLMKFLHGGRLAMKELSVELKPYEVDVDSADIIYIGTPIWASRVTPAINTFLQEYDLVGKKVALFFCSGGGNHATALDALLPRLSKAKVVGEISLKMPAVRNVEEQEIQLKKWAKDMLLK